MHEFNLLQIVCLCSKHCINQRRRLQSWAYSQSLCCIVLPLMKSLKGREQEMRSDFIVGFEQFFLLRNNAGWPKMTNNHYHLLNINPCQELHKAVSLHLYISFSHQCSGGFIIPILQKKKLRQRFRKWKMFFHGNLVRGAKLEGNQVYLAPGLTPLTTKLEPIDAKA